MASVKSQPVPLKLTACGLPTALSVKVRLPVAAPAAVGEKVTATVQDPLAATGVEVEQVVPVVARPKGPVMTIALMVRLVLPLFVSVTVCALLLVPTNCPAKAGGVDRLTVDTDAVPVPLTLTVCVLGTPLLLSVIVTVPAWAPAVVGSKVTAIVQLPLAATVPLVLGQVPEESSANWPLMVTLTMVRAPEPVLVTVTLFGELELFTIWLPKSGMLVAERFAAGTGEDEILATNPVCDDDGVLFVPCTAMKVGKSVDAVVPVT